MPNTDFQATDKVSEIETDVVGTPEGDGEYPEGVPLSKLPDEALQVPRGNDPDQREDLRPKVGL